MTKTLTKKEKRIKEIKEICEREILNSEIAIPFYQGEIAKCENDAQKAKLELQLKQITDALAFNTRYIDYLKSI